MLFDYLYPRETLNVFFKEVQSSKLNMIITSGGCIMCIVLFFVPAYGNISFFFYLLLWISLALSLNFIYGYGGYLPFGYFGFYGVGSYMTAMAYTHLDNGIAISIVLGGIGGILLGLVFYPMLRLDGIYFSIANFSGAYVVKLIIPLTPRWLTGGTSGIYLTQPYNPQASYHLILIITIILVLITVGLKFSRLGILLKATKDDQLAASINGVDIQRVRGYPWFLSAGFAGIIGGIDAWYTGIVDPITTFDPVLSVKVFLYVIFGGVGTTIGPILGATTIYSLTDLVWSYIEFGSYFFTGLLLVFVVLFIPKGIVQELKFRNYLDHTHYFTKQKDSE